MKNLQDRSSLQISEYRMILCNDLNLPGTFDILPYFSSLSQMIMRCATFESLRVIVKDTRQ